VAPSNVEVVQRLLERFSDASLDGAFDLLTEDFVIVVPPSMSAEPDVYEGHEGARRYMDGFEGFLDDVRFEASEMIEEGDHVISRMRMTGRGVTSGVEVSQDVVTLIRVVDGKVARIEAHPDLETARQALARAASSRPSA
jgi:ketosteroid isomerase-like protein